MKPSIMLCGSRLDRRISSRQVRRYSCFTRFEGFHSMTMDIPGSPGFPLFTMGFTGTAKNLEIPVGFFCHHHHHHHHHRHHLPYHLCSPVCFDCRIASRTRLVLLSRRQSTEGKILHLITCLFLAKRDYVTFG